MKNRWSLFILFATFALSASRASAAPSSWEDFCKEFPRACSVPADQKPLLATFLTYLNAWAEESLVNTREINLYARLSEKEAGEWLENIILIAQTQKRPDDALYEIAQWYRLPLQKISFSYLEETATSASSAAVHAEKIQNAILATAHWDAAQWETLSHYVFRDLKRNPTKKVDAFEHLSSRLAEDPGTFGKLLDIFRKFEGQKKWTEFFTSLSAQKWDGLIVAAQESNFNDTVAIWGDAYADYLSQAKDPKTMWSASELYRARFYPHAESEMFWVRAEHELDYSGRIVRAVFEPKLGERQVIEGKLTHLGYGEIEITNSAGRSFRLEENRDQTLFFFIQEDLPKAKNFDEYMQFIHQFYQKENEPTKACSLLMIG